MSCSHGLSVSVLSHVKSPRAFDIIVCPTLLFRIVHPCIYIYIYIYIYMLCLCQDRLLKPLGGYVGYNSEWRELAQVISRVSPAALDLYCTWVRCCVCAVLTRAPLYSVMWYNTLLLYCLNTDASYGQSSSSNASTLNMSSSAKVDNMLTMRKWTM